VSHWRGNAFEIPRPKVLKVEEGTEKSSRAVGYDDCIRLGDPLQSCCKVRSFPDNATLLSFARADQLADHNEPRRDADAHLQGHTYRGRELRYCLDEGETGADGPLGVVLVCMGIAEIREHTVAHVLGDEAAIPLDRYCAAAMIGADDSPQVLWIEPARQRGRPHQIAKHHRELAAFSGIPWFRFGLGFGLKRSWDGATKIGDRCQHFSPMSEQDADFLKVLIR
jgi:hypothetical protein